ncbi:MAG: fumarylacetoacetase [Fimbriimonas sp.]|nr:fumarylacetoacetase [Fimbriimonas sp.]
MRFIVSPTAKSWIKVDPLSHFPIQNLPFGMAEVDEENVMAVTRIGDFLVDIYRLIDEGFLPLEELLETDGFSDITREQSTQLRKALFDLFREGNPKLRDNSKLKKEALIPVSELNMVLPMPVGAFVDFYSGINHASNVGKMFRPDMPPLLPNYRHLPVGYNGRASSVVPSDVPIFRPKGQTKAADAESPSFGPTRELDFELEMGFFLAEGNDFGEQIPIERAEGHMLGLCLVNDWSARDVQRWEYQPLGPFLAKSFATSVSPWVVPMDAIEPFRVIGPKQDPEPLPYLQPSGPSHFDICLEVAIQTEAMSAPQVISRTNARELYWSFAQQLAHQTSNGTPTESGDLYASGTISGVEPGSFGSMLELAWRGQKPLVMQETGEERAFIEDGDVVSITGYCEGKGYRVGFGTLSNQVAPSL